MITSWRFLFGYLTISFCGDFTEQLLNAAAKNNIKIWNLIYKKGCITGNISVKNFLKLRYVKRGIKCKIKIISKNGLFFHLRKYAKRSGFYIGIILFLAIQLILSNFVWIINVVGNEKISKQEILDSCAKIGIVEGMYKKKLNVKYDAQKLLLQQKGLAWGSLNLEGCILTVNVSETAVSDKEQRETPSNIKASLGGKISKIDVKSGNVLVKVGDTVSKGDLLVSGVIERFSSSLFVYSEGTILAKTTRTYSAEGKFVQKAITQTGNVKNRVTIEFFKFKLPLFLGSVKGEFNYAKNINTLKLFNKKIPIKIAKEKFYFTQKDKVEYSAEMLEKMLYDDITNQVKESNLISAVESGRELICSDDGILLKITYDCEENIAVQDKIILDTEN